MFALVALLAIAQTGFSLTKQQFAAIQADVRLLEPPPNNFQAQADFFGGVVRLPFHDAGTYTAATGTYPPQGCVNLDDPANGGLAQIIQMIEPTYQKWRDVLTRADFWVLVGVTAIQDAGGPMIPYSWGRTDCNGDYPPLGLLPDAEKNWTEVYNVFVARMGLTVQDIVALIGAHTLGRAEIQNSGYEFYWVATANRFTVQFYRDLLAGWQRVTVPQSGAHQWDTAPPPSQGDPFMMLNTDMSLVYENVAVGSDTTGCTSTASGNCTPNSVTIDMVKMYANNQTRWFQDFTLGWNKMTSLGYKTLRPLE